MQVCVYLTGDQKTGTSFGTFFGAQVLRLGCQLTQKCTTSEVRPHVLIACLIQTQRPALALTYPLGRRPGRVVGAIDGVGSSLVPATSRGLEQKELRPKTEQAWHGLA